MSTSATATERPELPPPLVPRGAWRWMRERLFYSPASTLVTLGFLALFLLVVPRLADWAIVDAVWRGEGREACAGQGGACWVFIKVRLGTLLYGFYPAGERWRVTLAFLLFALLLMPALPQSQRTARRLLLAAIPLGALAGLALGGGGAAGAALLLVAAAAGLGMRVGPRGAALGLALTLGPLVAGALMLGGVVGLPLVETHYWGGLFLTLTIAAVGILSSLPLGILLALGRRSRLPVIRTLSIGFIEVIRGVPLVTVLFMASVMLPIFLPSGITIDKLLRALIGVSLFGAAYMAEVVRGGLQAIGAGQYEAAAALGLGYWRRMRLVILPQALAIVIPGIVNTALGLLKDTTLVAVIGLLDLIGTMSTATADPAWLGFATEGYVFVGLVFWVLCYALARYGRYLERALRRAR